MRDKEANKPKQTMTGANQRITDRWLVGWFVGWEGSWLVAQLAWLRLQDPTGTRVSGGQH